MEKQLFKNGAGKTAQIKGQDVYKGMPVQMYGQIYTVTAAKPVGVGFKVLALNAEGKEIEFKTKELDLVDEATLAAATDAAMAKAGATEVKRGAKTAPALAARFAFVTVPHDALGAKVQACLQMLNKASDVASLPWSGDATADRALLLAAEILALSQSGWKDCAAILADAGQLLTGETHEYKTADELVADLKEASLLVSAPRGFKLNSVPQWLQSLLDGKAAPAPAKPKNRAEAIAMGKADAAAIKAAEAKKDDEPRSVGLTDLERDVLVNGIYRNNFQDGQEGAGDIWVDQIIDNGYCTLVTKAQLPGVVTSLTKKGYAKTDGEGIQLTKTGLELARAAAPTPKADAPKAKKAGAKRVLDVGEKAPTNAKAAGLKDRGDAVAVYLRAATTPAEVHTLLTAVNFPELDKRMAEYARLSFGLMKMNLTNRLRGLVKKDLIKLPA